MSRKSLFKVSLVIVAAILLVAMSVVGCAREVVPPPEEKVIRIGSTPDLTGAYATIVYPIFQSEADYIKYINEQGGINGIPIEHFWADTGGSPAMVLSAYKRFMGRGMMAVMTHTSDETTCLLTFLKRDEIPNPSTASSIELIHPPPYYYCTEQMTYQADLFLIEYFLDKFKEKGLNRPMRVGCIGWDNPYGRSCVEPAVAYLEKTRPEEIEFTDVLWVPLLAMDYTTELTLIKAHNPDMIFFGGDGCSAGVIVRDAARVGISRDVIIGIDQGAMAEGGMKMGGAEMDRAYVSMGWYTFLEDVPGWRLDKELQMKYHGKIISTSTERLMPQLALATLFEAIKRALDKVGYENLTGEAIIKYGYSTIKDFGGEWGAPISFTDYPGDRVGHESLRILRYNLEKKNWLPLTDFIPARPIPEIDKVIGY